MRALDAAVLELGALSDRDKILECFFEHAKTLFDFAVLFVVKGDNAQGRNIHGLGAPAGLVQRISVPLTQRGILARAREQKKPFLAQRPSEEADQRLFGTLGRALPAPLVTPLVVRDRVVAIFLGESVAGTVTRRAAEIGRSPTDLVKDELMLLGDATGQVLERLILRRKGDSMRPSAPPPGDADLGMPPLPPPAPTGFAAPRPGTMPMVSAPLPRAPAVVTTDTYDPGLAEPAPKSRRALFVGLGLVVLVVLGVVWRFVLRDERRGDAIVAAGTTLKGWPHQVDPVGALEQAKKVTGVSGGLELSAIDAEVSRAGLVDFDVLPTNPEGLFLRYEFVANDVQFEVFIDARGIHAPRSQPRERCGEGLCRSAVPAPACTYAKVVENARAVGLADSDRPFIRYAAATGERAGSGAEWILSVVGRGSIRLDGTTCQPLPRERLRPPPLPIDKVPGAPNKVDPLDVVSLARTQSGLDPDAVLLEIEVHGLGANGLVDLTAFEASITYTFIEAMGQARRRWRQVTLRRDGMPIANDDGDLAPLPARLAGMATPPPRCTFAQARDYMTRGVQGVGPAQVTYGPDLAFQNTGQWTLEAAGLSSRRTINDIDCDATVRLNPGTPPSPKK